MDGELLVQLGHERGLVEMRSPPPAWWRPACFNGATSARSWKFAGHLWGMSLNVWLQWGHERALVEITTGLSKKTPGLPASMGPRARARGNNAIWRGAGNRSVLLQWGHERALVEIGGHPSFPQSLVVASMGPRALARGNGEGCTWRHRMTPASMGPRARARGNSAACSGAPICFLLQWGDRKSVV